MKSYKAFLSGILVTVSVFGILGFIPNKKESKSASNTSSLGAFSVSLTVKDLNKSVDFYKKMGFSTFADHTKMGYAIMKNGDCLIGLFQGMFDKNILTFNPGWDPNAKNVKKFTDVREIQKQLLERGLELTQRVDTTAKTGPAYITLEDPDGNQILIDQHR
jgi:catechol 2,3-dioxygenase-like lactoylglutathione lyase family enzyme